jgi:hypothetical protein
MATSEIEKLERRYTENPHGLTFAPLAEVHRKNGDVARALELLTAGLELHPNYIPASIVLGRCHQDQGDLPAAEAAFAHVLRLDDENVIALKSLADISERQQRYADAETWLRRLVSVDRSNEEAREQLERVEAALKNEPPQAAPAAATEMIDLSPEEPATQIAAEAPAAALPLDLEAVQASSPTTAGSGSDAEPMVAEAESKEGVALDIIMPEPETLPELREPAPAMPEAISVAPAASPPRNQEVEEVPADEPREGADVPVQPLTGLISAEFQPPLESTGGLDVETSDEVVLEPAGNSEFQVPDASEDLKSVAVRLSVPFDVAPSEEPAQSRQASVAQPPSQRSYLARDTNGQSVGAFFRALLAARPPGVGSTGLESNSGRDASTESSVTNGGAYAGGYGEENLPVPPAVPSGEQTGNNGVSFDTFFNPKPETSTPLQSKESEPGKDDLDQFQSWLQNLKR